MFLSIITYIAIALGLGAGTYLLIKIARIYQGPDRVWTKNEFQDMLAAFTFLGLSVYMIYKEANRTESWQLFGPLYILFVIGGLLSILGKDKILETVGKIWGKNKDEES